MFTKNIAVLVYKNVFQHCKYLWSYNKAMCSWCCCANMKYEAAGSSWITLFYADHLGAVSPVRAHSFTRPVYVCPSPRSERRGGGGGGGEELAGPFL